LRLCPIWCNGLGGIGPLSRSEMAAPGSEMQLAEGSEATSGGAPGRAVEPGAVERSEYRFALAVAVGVMAVTCLPCLICWYATPPGGVFPGVLTNADDHGVYFAWMRQARDG